MVKHIVNRLLAVLVSLLTALALVSGPAHAAIEPGDGDENDGGGDQSQTDGIRYGCRVSASASYLGITCPGGITGGQTLTDLFCWQTPKDVPDLANLDPKEDLVKWKGQQCLRLDRCWEDRQLTDEEIESLGLEPEEGFTYWWSYCLDEEYDLTPPYGGPTDLEAEITKLADGAEPRRITDLQDGLVREDIDGYSGVPRPFAAASPNMNVLVYRPIAFYDWNARRWLSEGHIQRQGDQVFIKVQAGDVYLKAFMVGTEVEPLGDGEPEEMTCPGFGVVVDVGDTPETHPNACWYRYEHSSAREDGNVYHVSMTSSWEVYVFREGEPETLDDEHFFKSFEKTAVTRVPVREVQAVVVY